MGDTAGYTGKAEAIEMIETNMSEDGIVVGDRYVGMGFIWNPDESGMTITLSFQIAQLQN